MIVNGLRDHRQNDESSWKKIHGLPLSMRQLQALKVWVTYVNHHNEQPTQMYLARTVGVEHSEISRWLKSWEAKGIIQRGSGHRNNMITPEGYELIREISELDGIWEDYLDRRQKLAERLGTSNSRKTVDTRI